MAIVPARVNRLFPVFRGERRAGVNANPDHQALGTRVDVLVAQMARHERYRDRESAGGLGKVGDQWAWPFLPGAGREHKDADVGVFVDQLDDLFGRIAFANDAVWRDARNFFCPSANLSSVAFAASCCSAFMMSATPSHC